MARIAGVDIPNNKRIGTSLTYIFGIGPTTAKKIVAQTGVNPDVRVKDLSEEDTGKLRNVIENDYKVEGTLRTEIDMNIRRLQEIGCYRGIRHRRGLPVHGQRTRTNARTRKGPKKTVPGRGRRRGGGRGQGRRREDDVARLPPRATSFLCPPVECISVRWPRGPRPAPPLRGARP